MHTDLDKLKEVLLPTTAVEVQAFSVSLETPWLGVEEIAQTLGTNRPYASMLLDAGKLGELRQESGQPRAARLAAVLAYQAAQREALASALSPRDAGVEAGLYGLPDAAYVAASRRRSES